MPPLDQELIPRLDQGIKIEKSKQSKPSESLKASKSEQEIRIPSIETEESPRQAVKQEERSAKSEEKSEPGV